MPVIEPLFSTWGALSELRVGRRCRGRHFGILGCVVTCWIVTTVQSRADPNADCRGVNIDLDRQIIACQQIAERASDKTDLAFAHFNLGRVWTAKKNFGFAIDSFSKALQADPTGPNTAMIYTNRGAAYARSGDTDLAISDYSKAIELKSNYGIAYEFRGLAFEVSGQRERALDDLRKALTLQTSPQSRELLQKKIAALEAATNKPSKPADAQREEAPRPRGAQRLSFIITNETNYKMYVVFAAPCGTDFREEDEKWVYGEREDEVERGATATAMFAKKVDRCCWDLRAQTTYNYEYRKYGVNLCGDELVELTFTESDRE